MEGGVNVSGVNISGCGGFEIANQSNAFHCIVFNNALRGDASLQTHKFSCCTLPLNT